MFLQIPITLASTLNYQESIFGDLVDQTLNFGVGTNMISGAVIMGRTEAGPDGEWLLDQDPFTFTLPEGAIIEEVTFSTHYEPEDVNSWVPSTVGGWAGFPSVVLSYNQNSFPWPGMVLNISIPNPLDYPLDQDFTKSLDSEAAGSRNWSVYIFNGDWGTRSGYLSVRYSVSFDVKPVPLPATLWLFGSGIAGIAGIKKKLIKS